MAWLIQDHRGRKRQPGDSLVPSHTLSIFLGSSTVGRGWLNFSSQFSRLCLLLSHDSSGGLDFPIWLPRIPKVMGISPGCFLYQSVPLFPKLTTTKSIYQKHLFSTYQLLKSWLPLFYWITPEFLNPWLPWPSGIYLPSTGPALCPLCSTHTPPQVGGTHCPRIVATF